MTDYLTEQEQIEILKNWIKQYGLMIILGVVLALLSLSGWHYWQNRQMQLLSQASAVYDEMLSARGQNNPKEAAAQAQKLLSDYPGTSYSTMAALMLARSAIVQKNFAEAEKQFTWIFEHSNIASIRQIARLRLARLLLNEKKFDVALQTLAKVEDDSFVGMIEETKGDVYFLEHNNNAAHEAYKKALAALPNAEVTRPLLQMKYDNLTTANELKSA